MNNNQNKLSRKYLQSFPTKKKKKKKIKHFLKNEVSWNTSENITQWNYSI